MKQGRENEATEFGFFLEGEKPLHTGLRTGYHNLICLSVCVCVTFVVFADCERCTRLINPPLGYMEASEYGL